MPQRPDDKLFQAEPGPANWTPLEVLFSHCPLVPREREAPETTAGDLEPDRIIGTMKKDRRKKVGVMLRTHRGRHVVDIREISIWPVLTWKRSGVTYSLDQLPGAIDDLHVLHGDDCYGNGQIGFGNVRKQGDAARRFVDFKTEDLPSLIALLQRAHEVAVELGMVSPPQLRT